MNKVDIRRALTLESGNLVPTSGLIQDSVLSQPVIDKLVTQLVEYNNPVRLNLPRKKGSGYAWHLNRRTPLGNVGGAAGSTYYAFTADTNTFDQFEGTGTYAQHDFIYRTIGAQGKVTRKAQAVGQTYSNILADELEAKAMEFRDKEDYAMLWTHGTSGTLGYAENGWSGIYHLADAANRFPDSAGQAAATMTLEVLDNCIDAIRGDCNMIITSKKGRRKINMLLQAHQRFNDKIEVKGGFKVLSYNDIPIFTSSNCFDTGVINESFYGTTAGPEGGDAPGLTAMTGGNMSTIFFLDTSKVFMGVLTEITVQPLAKTTSQYDVFDIYCDEVPVCRDPKAVSILHFNTTAESAV